MKESPLERKRKFLEAAERFSEKAVTLSSVLEVVVFGSLGTPDPEPSDIDIAVMVGSNSDLSRLADFSRKISSVTNAWEVWLFDPGLEFLGFLCSRKECPRAMTGKRCDFDNCGQIQNIGTYRSFRFRKGLFLGTGILPLKTRNPPSHFMKWRESMGFSGPQMEERVPKKLECIECGKEFTFSVQEQKYFEKRNFSTPRRCEECRLERRYPELGTSEDL